MEIVMTDVNPYPEFNPKIRIHDDKKEKWRSFTASVDTQIQEPHIGLVEAYGANADEAKGNLVRMLDNLVDELQYKRDQIKKQLDEESDSE